MPHQGTMYSSSHRKDEVCEGARSNVCSGCKTTLKFNVATSDLHDHTGSCEVWVRKRQFCRW